MKIKRWLSVFLCMLLCIGLIPTMAFAANEGELWVNGEDIIQAENNTVTCGEGTAVYDPDSQTLTLTNATITKINLTSRAIDIPNNTVLKIVLIGENTISGSANGFYAGLNGDILFTGTGNLSITSSGYAPFVSYSDVTVDGVTIEVSNTIDGAVMVDSTLTIQNEAFVKAEGLYYGIQSASLSVTDSTVTATSSSDYCNAIYVMYGDLSILNSAVIATNTSEEAFPTIFAQGDITISNSRVEATCDATGAVSFGINSAGTISINGTSDVTAIGGIYASKGTSVTPADGGKVDVKAGVIENEEAGATHYGDSPYSSAVTFDDGDSALFWSYVHIKNHEHVFDQQIVSDEYLATSATCELSAQYYYSCICGAKGTATFENGNANGHTWGSWTGNGDGTHSRTCSDCGDTESENCSGGTATCTAQAVCTECSQSYGSVDLSNHTGTVVWVQTETTHKQVYNCCQTEVSAEESHNWENGKCTVCDYPCTHTGGTATCSQLAVCDICGSQYGDYDADNHKAVSAWTQENGKHYHKCEYGCDTHLDEADCSGGEAICTAPAVCETCGNAYGAINPDNHTGEIVWTKTATTHSSAYSCCNAPVVTEEAHDWENGVCSECGYECQHTGGTATCTQKAVCDICGEEYGEINAASHTNLVKTEAKPATHMTEGNIEYWYCDGCDKYFSDEAGTKEIALANTVIPKLTEHTADGTGWHSAETNHWNTCECGEKLNEAAHTFEWVIDKEATATEKGSKHEECTVCGYEKAAVEIPATGTAEDPSEPPADTDKPSVGQTGDTTSPQTGDDSNIALWIAVLFAAGAALTGTAVYSRKRKYSK